MTLPARGFAVSLLAFLVASVLAAEAFVTPNLSAALAHRHLQKQQHQQHHRLVRFSHDSAVRTPSSMRMSPVDPESEIARQLEKARAVLAKSKAKIESREMMVLGDSVGDDADRTNDGKSVPFFARADQSNKKERVVKSRNEQGLITTDGDMMARLSEEEQWESRPLTSVFRDETQREDSTSSLLADRDVAASIFNLRKSLQTEDYRKIFDKRNRFIGEE